MNDPNLDQAVLAAAEGDVGARRRLAARLAADPLQRALFPAHSDRDRTGARLALLLALLPAYRRVMAGFMIDHPGAAFLFEIVLPLAEYIAARATAAERCLLVGLGGGPGVGKTTQSSILAACLPLMAQPAQRCLSLSLDDFYFPPEERRKRGHKWRTLPGSHDTGRLCGFVEALDGGAPMAVPRYDLARDCPLPDQLLEAPPDICIFDGAMVGARCPGYDTLARRLDVLIYLDAPIDQLRHWRFGREQKIRERSGGAAGFSETEMQAFWDEALRPSITQWVMPNAGIADVVLEIGPERNLLGVRQPQTDRLAVGR